MESASEAERDCFETTYNPDNAINGMANSIVYVINIYNRQRFLVAQIIYLIAHIPL